MSASDEKITDGQVDEFTRWVKRLSRNDAVSRRHLLRLVTDPLQILSQELLWPFEDKLPVEKGFGCVIHEGLSHEHETASGEFEEKLVDISELELVPFHGEGEFEVYGGDALARACDQEKFPDCAMFGLHTASQLVRRVGELPAEWTELYPDQETGPIIMFMGTVLSHVHEGDRRVPVLMRTRDRKFGIYYRLLRNDCLPNCHFIRPKQKRA